MLVFVETVDLHPDMVHTPIDKDAPLAPVVLIRYGRIPMWRVLRCPYCGHTHEHSAGDPGDDPRRHLGGRVAHCHPKGDRDEYRLIAIEGKPTTEELDAHFPTIPTPSIVVGLDAPPITATRLRADVWDKTSGRCWYCGTNMHPFRNYQVDHVIPRIDGGADEIDNLVPACSACNGRKGARPASYLRRFFGDGRFWAEREGLA